MLWLKMIRDIKGNIIAYLACMIVITIGLISYAAISISKDNLFIAQEQFYKHYNFADGFATVRTMPYAQLKKLQNIEGVDQLQGRLVKDVRVIMPERDENIYLRLISINKSESNPINGVKLIKGSFPQEKDRSILLADKFYTANHLSLSDTIVMIIDGKKVELPLAGTGQSPEYVYAIKDGQSIAPEPENFEVAYMNYEEMEALFNEEGRVNDIIFTLKPGSTFTDVEEKIKTELKKYGMDSLIPRKDQLSNVMLSEELNQLEGMSKTVPVLFLTIATTILYIMLKRLVESQRGQIGMFKAMGYRTGEILVHYMSFGLFIGFFGGVTGGLMGTTLSMSLTKVYQTYYSLPNLTARFSWKYFLYGMVLSIFFGLVAAFQGAKGVLKLQPADAMHPPAPVLQKKTIFDYIPALWSIFTVQGRMAIRNVLRNRGRSFFTFIGIMFTFSMMGALLSMNGLMDIMVKDQFTKSQKQDVKISFTRPLDGKSVLREFKYIKGVKGVEPMLEVPVTLRHKNYKKDIIALGITEKAELYKIFDKNGKEVKIPKEGVLVSERVAEKLRIQTGDKIQIESPWAKDSPFYIVVAGIIPQYMGVNIYMNQDTLNNLLKQGDMSTSILIAVENSQISALKEEYRLSKNVGIIEERQKSIDKYEELMATSGYSMWIMSILAVVTGFAIVYNSSIITLAERKKELASLRVMGMTHKEVLEVVSVEQWFIGIFGILAGIPLTYLMLQGISKGMNNDIFTIPAIVDPSALILAFIGTVLAIGSAQGWVKRKIHKMDLVEVLKERE